MENYEERILKEYFGQDEKKYINCLMRLKSGEPLDYIIGESAFYSEMYTVTPDVLIPRFDTERVVDKVLECLPDKGRMADLCCGSGCIGISSLCHSKESTCLSVDISPSAIDIAAINSRRNNVQDRISFITSDLKELELEDDTFDVIASNPPYVRTSDCRKLPIGCQHEPYIAFDGGQDGFDFYRLIVSRFTKALKADGKFIFEIGYDQKNGIEEIAEHFGFNITVYKDYGGNDRVAVLERKKQ